MNKDEIYIYTISDPITLLVRYVGKTKNTKERFRKHLTENNNTYKSKWIKGLRIRGLIPLFEIIDVCNKDNWEDAEKRYIKLYKSIGANLLNQMPGGEGGATMLGRSLTLEQCKKISDSKLGKRNPQTSITNVAFKGCKVVKYDKDWNFIGIYDSINQAAKSISRCSRRVQMMVNNDPSVPHVGGYKFKKLNGANT